MKKVLITGGAGFIGSNFIRYALRKHPDWQLINLDKLTYAGNLDNLKDIENNPNYTFIRGDITDRQLVRDLLKKTDVLVNFAAESHVDRSILDSSPFIDTNVRGTQTLLEGARQCGVGRFIQISTDEVYGSLGARGKFKENTRLAPNSPYAASKASADLLCLAYRHTYNLPVIITRSSNNFGPYQFPEKLIPLAVTNLLDGKAVPVYGDGLNVRDWVYVEDNCRALDMVILEGKTGRIYNIGGDNEKTNLELVHRILDIMKKPRSLITFVMDRPGHDRRYALDTTKIKRKLGWEPKVSFEDGLEKTVRWYQENEEWWRKLK